MIDCQPATMKLPERPLPCAASLGVDEAQVRADPCIHIYIKAKTERLTDLRTTKGFGSTQPGYNFSFAVFEGCVELELVMPLLLFGASKVAFEVGKGLRRISLQRTIREFPQHFSPHFSAHFF